MFSFFKRSKSRTPSNGEKLHNPKILDEDVTSCSKNTEHQLPILNVNEKKLIFHENVNQFQNDTNSDRTSTNFNDKNNIGCGTKSTTVEIPVVVKKPSIFAEIMAKGRNRHRNKNKNNYKKNDQQHAALSIDHNISGFNNNNNNNSDNSNNSILNNDTITKTRINDHIDHTEEDDHHHHQHDHHNRIDVGDDEKQNENFSSSNLFLNNKNDENKNNFVEIKINHISNNINFAETTCTLPSSPSTTTTTTTITSATSTDAASVPHNSAKSINEEATTPPIDHNHDADFVKCLIINKFKMGQPSSKIATDQPQNISNNNNSNSDSNNNNNYSNILEDQSDKEIFYEATDNDDNDIVLNEKPVLPDLNQLIEIQINECENIPNLDLICNNSHNLIVNESDDNISSSDNSSENGGNTVIESRILFDLRNELNEIKKQHKVTNSSSVQNNLENNAFNNNNNDDDDDDNDIDNFSEKPKSIIKNKFDHAEKIKKRVTFLPDLVESTSIPPIHDDHKNDIDDEYNQDDDDDDISIELNSDNDDDDDDDNDDDEVDHEIKIVDEVLEEEEEDQDKCKNEYHVEFETSSSEEDLEKDANDLDDQNSLIIVEEIDTSEEDSSIIEENIIPRDLVNQESRFNEKLEKVENEKTAAQLKLEDLEIKIDILEKEHSIKTWNVERLQAELISAYTEGECVRKRLKQHEEDLTASRSRCAELEEEWSIKYDELQTKYEETQERLNEIKKFCSLLQIQLAEAKSDLEKSRKDISDLTEQHEQEQKLLDQAIDSAIHERSESEIKWKKEFEQLRSVNSEREEHLMEDCEWQLRNMQKICKDKVELAEREKLETLNRAKEIELDAHDKYNQIEHLKSYEAEVNQLRGLTNGQRESMQSMTKQIEDLKTELQAATERAESEIENMKQMKWHCEMEIYDNQRYTTQKIETETMAIACQWEQKLLEEMARLTNELNQVHGEERQEAVEQARAEGLKQLEAMKSKYDEIDAQRKNEIASLTKALQNKHDELESSQSQADTQLVQARMFLERAEHEHQTVLDREIEKHEELLQELREQHENEKHNLEEQFIERLQHVKDEFAVELTNTTTELTEKHKKSMQNQQQQLQKEKDEALQALDQKYKHKLSDFENKFKEQELSQQRIVDELKSAHKMERSILEQRDHQNNKEIETLHRKCRCLTNLFEEMRMRYERRDPRGEDLREIEELKNRCDQQENDLRNLTERLREFQLLNEQPNPSQTTPRKNNKNQQRKNSQPSIKVPSRNNIDVIYEEVEPENSANSSGLNHNNNNQTAENVIEQQ